VVANVAEERAVAAANSRCFVFTSIFGQFKAVLDSDRQQNDNHYSSFPRAEVQAILDAFAKFQQATISFIISLRTCVRMEKLSSHSIDFHEILHLSVFDTNSTTFNYHLN
jgi:hypothetical protein